MPLDAICLSAVREELTGQIIGMRIDKVQQPERDIIILTLRGAGATRRLLLSSGTGDARIHLTEHQFENPASPPMFCMLLRKHITGARIVSLTQPPAERMMDVTLSAPDAMGVLSEKHLILELVGRFSNIILTGSDDIIIDCLRRIGGELSDRRAVLPGLVYRLPPPQEGKLDPYDISDDVWGRIYNKSTEKTADKWLLSSFSALSPLICRELSWRAYGETDFRIDVIEDGGAALRKEFFGLISAAKARKFEPWSIIDENNAPQDFSFTRIMQYESALSIKRETSFSALLDKYYTLSAQHERVRQRASATVKAVRTARDRLVRKLAAQQEELKKTDERDVLRECGDIITANLHLMKKGMSELIAQDLYSDDGSMRSIRLDPNKTPQQNAARYYKDYSKAKNAGRYLAEQIQTGENELEYLESVLEEIKLVEGERDIQSIRSELSLAGYIKAQKQSKDRIKESEPMQFISSSGRLILVGRNNIQNDRLTLKTALKSDLWFHIQKAHGSHVILDCGGETPDETSLYEAAVIAAFYSSARGGGKVPVDYTLVRHVKKPAGGKPGMVIYTDYKTIIVVPDEEVAASLRRS